MLQILPQPRAGCVAIESDLTSLNFACPLICEMGSNNHLQGGSENSIRQQHLAQRGYSTTEVCFSLSSLLEKTMDHLLCHAKRQNEFQGALQNPYVTVPLQIQNPNGVRPHWPRVQMHGLNLRGQFGHSARVMRGLRGTVGKKGLSFKRPKDPDSSISRGQAWHSPPCQEYE